jgi:hypothetical protein
MHATIRRYDAIDQTRTTELVKNAENTLLPSLGKLPGFKDYYLIEAGNGAFSSVCIFDTAEHAEKLQTALPNAPITGGTVVVHNTREFATA